MSDVQALRAGLHSPAGHPTEMRPAGQPSRPAGATVGSSAQFLMASEALHNPCVGPVGTTCVFPPPTKHVAMTTWRKCQHAAEEGRGRRGGRGFRQCDHGQRNERLQRWSWATPLPPPRTRTFQKNKTCSGLGKGDEAREIVLRALTRTTMLLPPPGARVAMVRHKHR
jgi:hypothetical protein